MNKEQELREAIERLDAEILLELDMSTIKDFANKAVTLFGKDNIPATVAIILYQVLKYFVQKIKHINSSAPDYDLSDKVSKLTRKDISIRFIAEAPASGIISYGKTVYVKESLKNFLTEREMVAYIIVHVLSGDITTVASMFYQFQVVTFLAKLIDFVGNKLKITSRNYGYQTLFIAIKMLLSDTIYVLAYSVISKRLKLSAMTNVVKDYKIQKDLISAYKKMLAKNKSDIQLTKLGQMIKKFESLLKREPSTAEKLNALIDDPEKAEILTRSLIR